MLINKPFKKGFGFSNAPYYKAAGGGGGLMLDGITAGLKAAYSTRKLLTAYAGSAIRVQRDIDNATLDIGFVSNVLDTTSLIAFGSTSSICNVITWYDQSGAGLDLTQATFARAPTIVNNGAGGVRVLNSSGKPALFYNAFNNPVSLANASITENPVNTLFMNAVANSNGSNETPLVGGTANNNLYWRLAGGSLLMQLEASNTADLGNATIAQNATSGSVLEMQYNQSTGGVYWVDGASAGTTISHTFAGGSTLSVGFDIASSAGFLLIGELVMYDQVGSFGFRTTLEANQKTYWGTP